MTSTLRDRFAAVVAANEAPRFSKLLHSPVRLLYSKCLEVYARQFRAPVWRRAGPFWGVEVHVVFPEGMSMALYRYQFFERGLTQYLLDLLKPGMVFFDVGAHFGYYSLLASRLVGGEGAVHAFEPTPSTFDVLRRNHATKAKQWARNVAA